MFIQGQIKILTITKSIFNIISIREDIQILKNILLPKQQTLKNSFMKLSSKIYVLRQSNIACLNIFNILKSKIIITSPFKPKSSLTQTNKK